MASPKKHASPKHRSSSSSGKKKVASTSILPKKHVSFKNQPSSHSGTQKVSGKQKVSGRALVNSKIKVWWPLDRRFYKGRVKSYDSAEKRHLIHYDDGDTETLDLEKERWEIVRGYAEAKVISQKESSGSDVTPEALDVKKVKGSEKASEKGRFDMKKGEGNEKASEKGRLDMKKTQSSDKESAKGKLVDVKQKDKDNINNAKTSKNVVSGSNNQKQKRPLSPSETVSEQVKKPQMFSRKVKFDISDDEQKSKSTKTSKNVVSASNNQKQTRPLTPSDSVSEKVKKPTMSSKTVKFDISDDEQKSKSTKTSKNVVSGSNNQKQTRPLTPSDSVSEKVKKPTMSSKTVKFNDSNDEEESKSTKTNKNVVSGTNNLKQKSPLSPSETVSEKVKKPELSSKKVKFNDSNDEEESKSTETIKIVVSGSNNQKQTRPLTPTETASEKVKKPDMSSRKVKFNDSNDEEESKSIKTSKNVVSGTNIQKQKSPLSPSETVSEKVKEPKMLSRKVRFNISGDEEESKSTKTSKNVVSGTNNQKQERPLPLSETVSEKVKKPQMLSKKVKFNDSNDEEESKSTKTSKKVVSGSNNLKQKRPLSPSETVSEKVKKPQMLSKKVNFNDSNDEEESKSTEISKNVVSGSNNQKHKRPLSPSETEPEMSSKKVKFNNSDDEESKAKSLEKSNDGEGEAANIGGSEDEAKAQMSKMKQSLEEIEAMFEKREGKIGREAMLEDVADVLKKWNVLFG